MNKKYELLHRYIPINLSKEHDTDEEKCDRSEKKDKGDFLRLGANPKTDEVVENDKVGNPVNRKCKDHEKAENQNW